MVFVTCRSLQRLAKSLQFPFSPVFRVLSENTCEHCARFHYNLCQVRIQWKIQTFFDTLKWVDLWSVTNLAQNLQHNFYLTLPPASCQNYSHRFCLDEKPLILPTYQEGTTESCIVHTSGLVRRTRQQFISGGQTDQANKTDMQRKALQKKVDPNCQSLVSTPLFVVLNCCAVSMK